MRRRVVAVVVVNSWLSVRTRVEALFQVGGASFHGAVLRRVGGRRRGRRQVGGRPGGPAEPHRRIAAVRRREDERLAGRHQLARGPLGLRRRARTGRRRRDTGDVLAGRRRRGGGVDRRWHGRQRRRLGSYARRLGVAVRVSLLLPAASAPAVHTRATTIMHRVTATLLVRVQVTIIFIVSVCLSVCLCRVFLSRL